MMRMHTDAVPKYAPGERVHLRSDRSRVGQIATAPRRVGAEFWYRVHFMVGPAQVVPEADLDRFSDEVTLVELLGRNAFGDRDDFLRLVTFYKLNVPLDNTLYSLQSSRTEFYPHQYRPLVKFLDSNSQRLLIADEVGLGKTIEAGLIMSELRARRALRRMLVVCPKALCGKWKDEMWRRFDEEFDIYTADDVRGLVDLLQERGEIGDLRAIVSLQSLRRESLLELVEANRIPLDLVVIDEAHHLRNPTTLSHKVAVALTEYADAVILLTATPIQIGNENLFNLLRILDPQEFEDFETFQDRLSINEPVVEAERLLRSAYPPPLMDVLDRLQRLERGRAAAYFARNPLYTRLRDTLAGQPALSRAEVAKLQHDVKELNLLGHVFTRTRKREVFASAAVRTPRVLRPEVTDAEKRFYNLVTDFVRSTAQSESGMTHHFAAIMAQRQVASCIPAARARFRDRALEHLSDPEESDVSDQMWFETEEERAERISLPDRVLDAARDLGETDTKFDCLLGALQELEDAEPGRKILLFSYFRDTLHYLQRRLDAAGFPCEVITGEVRADARDSAKDERGRRMARFRDMDSPVRILLSSEVGSEGLDFQFAHILINYDLPWNPMLVEQRIGRLDRLGQKSDRIIIFNFSIPGTIEDRILQRLYNRIGIFERSIGDLEAILGDEITRLTRDLMSRNLTPEEEEARIDQTAQVIERRKVELEKLESDSARFVGGDSYFEEQLERARRGGELLAPEDLEAFFRAFLDNRYARSRLREDDTAGVYMLDVDDELAMALRQQPGGAPKFRLLQRIHSGAVRVTFRSDLAFNDDGVEFLAAHHPLMTLTTAHYRQNIQELHPVTALTVAAPSDIAAGPYVYGLFEVTIRSGRERKRLEATFVSLTDAAALPDSAASELLGQLLRGGRRWEEAPTLEPDTAEAVVETVERQFLSRLEERRQETTDRNVAITETRIASLTAAYNSRIRRKHALLHQARVNRRQERYIRMLEGMIRNMEADHELRLRELEGERAVFFSCQMVGCGILNLEPSR